MNTRKAGKTIIVILCLAAVPAATETLRAQDAPRLSVSLSSPRTSLLQYEPLVLHIHIANTGITKRIIGEPDPLTYDFTVRITDPSGETRRFISGGCLTREMRRLVLEPGQAYKCRFVVHYGWLYRGNRTEGDMGHAFPRPGRYTLTVQYPPRHGAVAALKVHVSEPVGRDKQALELFRRWKHRPFIERLIKKPPPPELRRLATDYPETVYGRYARFYLATLVLQHRFDWEEARRKLASELAGLDPFEAELRMFDEVYANTAAEFADLARSESAFPLADQCLLYQARCYTGSLANRQAEAVAVLKDLVKRFPQSPVAVKAKKRLEKLGKKVPAPTTRPSSP